LAPLAARQGPLLKLQLERMFSVRLEQYSCSFFFSAPATTQKNAQPN
jgi:hypothetical protein